MSIHPKQQHEACECAWCELHQLPDKWRTEAKGIDARITPSEVLTVCANELQQLLESADVLGRGKERR